MLNTTEISGQGFTVIVSDSSTEVRSQQFVNQLFVELQELLGDYGFEISIVCTNEEAITLQGKLLIDKMFRKLNKLCQEDDAL
jgi:hypothetical protein